MNIKDLLEEFLSVLVPRPCPLCRSVVLERGEAFCAACLGGFDPIGDPVCSCCGAPLVCRTPQEEDSLCPRCLGRGPGRPALLAVRSAAVYSGNLRKAILRMKFGGQTSVAGSLGLYMRERYTEVFEDDAFETLLPVPLHPKRLREREFNQSVLLARPLARRLRVRLELDAVERVRHTLPQSASNEADRRKNLRGAFRVRRPERVKGGSVLLLDDVYTTGATLEELARCLLSGGARRVSGFTLARSPDPKVP